MSLVGSKVVVVGAGTGIGQAIAQSLCQAGATVAIGGELRSGRMRCRQGPIAGQWNVPQGIQLCLRQSSRARRECQEAKVRVRVLALMRAGRTSPQPD